MQALPSEPLEAGDHRASHEQMISVFRRNAPERLLRQLETSGRSVALLAASLMPIGLLAGARRAPVFPTETDDQDTGSKPS